MPRLVADLPPTIYRKLIWLKEQQGFGEKDWAVWLTYLGRGVGLTQSMSQMIQETTSKGLYQMWMENLAENLHIIRYGQEAQLLKPANPKPHTILELAKPEPTRENPPDHTAIVVGAGPSVFQNKHLKLLAESNYKGMIIATDKMLVPCLKEGIVPTVTVSVDGSPIISKFYQDPIVKEHGDKIKVISTLTVNPIVTQTIIENGGVIYWFAPMFDIWTEEDSISKLIHFLTRTKYNEKGAPITQAGGNAGATAWIITWELLKSSPIGLIGFDMGYPLDTKLDETPYYSTVLGEGTKPNERIQAVQGSYTQIYNPYFKTWAKLDAVFAVYRKSLLSMAKEVKPWILNKTFNCTEGGTLFGRGISCMYFKDFLKKYKS